MTGGGGKKNISFTNVSNETFSWKIDKDGNNVYIEKKNGKNVRKIIKYKKNKIIEVIIYIPKKIIIKINSKGKIFH